MADMTDTTIRPVTDDEYPEFVTAFMEGFSADVPSETFAEREKVLLPPDRTLAAFDGDAIVGTFGGYDLRLTVPGGSMPMEGTTVVTVFPTHRRMGLMREMMRKHLDKAVEAGYPIAGLWASETDIYGRYGYGIASYFQSLKMVGPRISFRDEVEIDRVRRISADDAASVLPPVFQRKCLVTPGMLERSDVWWEHFVLADEEWMRKGKTKRRYVVHHGPDGVDGYVSYRNQSAEGDDGHDNGTVHVIEFIATTARAEASLWTYLTRVDGAPNIDAWNIPIDHVLPEMVREPRRIRTSRVSDSLWIRILDVEAALSGRTYEEDGSISVALTDMFRPQTAGSYRLEIVDGAPSVQRVDTAGLEMEIDVLGALFLGGANARSYAAAGRIEGSESDVDTLHRMFRTVQSPWIDTVF
jgi:predicted acetyltransferase